MDVVRSYLLFLSRQTHKVINSLPQTFIASSQAFLLNYYHLFDFFLLISRKYFCLVRRFSPANDPRPPFLAAVGPCRRLTLPQFGHSCRQMRLGIFAPSDGRSGMSPPDSSQHSNLVLFFSSIFLLYLFPYFQNFILRLSEKQYWFYILRTLHEYFTKYEYMGNTFTCNPELIYLLWQNFHLQTNKKTCICCLLFRLF